MAGCFVFKNRKPTIKKESLTMPKPGKKTKLPLTSDRFEYHTEDMDCPLCKYWLGKKGCSRAVCCCTEEKLGAMAKGRLTRKRGSLKWGM
jgi:hypothetical protein